MSQDRSMSEASVMYDAAVDFEDWTLVERLITILLLPLLAILALVASWQAYAARNERRAG